MNRLVARLRREPVLCMTVVLAVASRFLSPADVGLFGQVLELALYLGLGVVVRQRVTPGGDQ